MAKQKASPPPTRRWMGGVRLLRWAVRVASSILLWTALLHLSAFFGLPLPRSPLRAARPSCIGNRNSFITASSVTCSRQGFYRSNDYLLISCNGGLNQMRAALLFNDFVDIFDVNHFVDYLRDEVKIVRELPRKCRGKVPLSMQPISWSSEKYYLRQILPLLRKHKVVRFSKTDFSPCEQWPPSEAPKVYNYNALRFTPSIEALGNKMISTLRKMDHLLCFMYAYPWCKQKEINSEKKRLQGLCPLTPRETTSVLKALGFPRDTRIYIASGEIYGGEKRLAALKKEFPNIVRKEMLLSEDDNDGNMAKVVEGHRRFMGFRRTIQLDRKKLVELIDLFEYQELSRDEFCSAVKELHEGRMSQPTGRKVIAGQPKEEDYFYANPHECLGPARKRMEKVKHTEI
ncbi:hypothetical protein BRADI_1g63591v3 [Brachypodium distachyon]|uniref:O-fucosyltransferase family protein n=1 Tax=Brachypodium distachyon TaxID=15368 RepID=A0A0Q3SAB1_BRADI|nr:hypothetical protein BRADI_1g63591v3 [Brachypodium distachyon]